MDHKVPPAGSVQPGQPSEQPMPRSEHPIAQDEHVSIGAQQYTARPGQPTARGRMPLSQRAKIFVPFDPLRGFQAALREQERLAEERFYEQDFTKHGNEPIENLEAESSRNPVDDI